MEQFIGCDAHKKYSVFVAVNERGEASQAVRVGHDREQYRRYLQQLPAASQIALEASEHYYWISFALRFSSEESGDSGNAVNTVNSEARGSTGFGWHVFGSGIEAGLSEERRQILVLLEVEGPQRPAQIALLLRKNANTTRVLLSRLWAEGLVQKTEKGLYTLSSVNTVNRGRG